jgi:hypothetical protein
MEDIKLVKKIADWNFIGVTTRGRPKNRCREELIDNLKNIKQKLEPNLQR